MIDLSFYSVEDIVNEIQKRFDIFLLCGNKLDQSGEDSKNLLDTSWGDINKKYKRIELAQCGKDLFGSLGLLEIIYMQTETMIRHTEKNAIDLMSKDN